MRVLGFLQRLFGGVISCLMCSVVGGVLSRSFQRQWCHLDLKHSNKNPSSTVWPLQMKTLGWGTTRKYPQNHIAENVDAFNWEIK